MLLKEFLKPLGVTQADAAARLGVPFQRLNAVVNGRRAVSADTALRLAAFTGMDAPFWLGLQADYDLWHARRAVNLTGITRLRRRTVANIAQTRGHRRGHKIDFSDIPESTAAQLAAMTRRGDRAPLGTSGRARRRR
jgi:addiction module HigA family antidote